MIGGIHDALGLRPISCQLTTSVAETHQDLLQIYNPLHFAVSN